MQYLSACNIAKYCALALHLFIWQYISAVREQSLKMLQTGAEEFKVFLWKISHPKVKFYLGFIPQQKNEKKVNTPTTKKKFNYRSLQQAKE